MLLYTYDNDGVLIGTKEARLSPARIHNDDGSPNWLIPAMSTELAPPMTAPGQVAVFDGENWRVEKDHRGQLAFVTATRQPTPVTALGPIPEGCTLLPPPGVHYTWDGAAWQPDMGAIRAAAEAAIDAQADAQLEPYMTLSPGRAMTYMAKEAQAREFLAVAEPDLADFPLIAGEVGITAETAQGVAETILTMSRAWHSVGAAIESARLGAKAAVRKAATPEAVQDVFSGLAWPVLG